MAHGTWSADGRQIVWTTPMQVDIVGLSSDELPPTSLGELRFRALPNAGVVEFLGGVREGTDWEQMKSFITWVDENYQRLAQRPDPQGLGWSLCPPDTGWQWWMAATR